MKILAKRSVVLLLGWALGATAAQAKCGDRVHDPDEACDDGAVASGDGCSADCQVESGWTCTQASLSQSFVEVLWDEAEIRGGFHRPPVWVPSSTADSVLQVENAKASVYGTEIPLSEVTLTLDLRAETSGDDFLGLTAGYTPGAKADENADWLLLDWKREDYRSSDCRGSAGLALSRVQGPIQEVEDLWCHVGAVEELARANTLGSQGWVPGRSYRVTLQYSRSEVRVYVDGALEITASGFFPMGNLGLYDFSQEGARFNLVSPQGHSVCAGLDSDQDGLADAFERGLGLKPDQLDSDGDGVSDRRELGDRRNPLDTDQDGVINALDTDDDGDGARSVDESWDGNRDPGDDDTDRDALPDFLDGDDDGDGLPTQLERRGNTPPNKQDSDGDGRPDMVDIDDDGDGVLTIVERVGATAPDHDRDGTPDFHDPDDDGDTILTARETYDGDQNPANDDTDRDGLPDYLDIDDDGDSLSTAEETQSSGGTVDLDFDGRPDHIDGLLELPVGLTEPPPPPPPEPPPEEPSPAAVEQLGAALEQGLNVVQDAAPQTGCGCGGGAAATPFALLGALGLLLTRRGHRSAP